MGVGGIVVSIAAFQAVDPGSIPGQRTTGSFFSLEARVEQIGGERRAFDHPDVRPQTLSLLGDSTVSEPPDFLQLPRQAHLLRLASCFAPVYDNSPFGGL